jgi:hypothetical protein
MSDSIEARAGTRRSCLYWAGTSENYGSYDSFNLEGGLATFEHGFLNDGDELPEARFVIEIPAGVLKEFYQRVRQVGEGELVGENRSWSLKVQLEEVEAFSGRKPFKRFICELDQQVNPSAVRKVSFSQPLSMVDAALGIPA